MKFPHGVRKMWVFIIYHHHEISVPLRSLAVCKRPPFADVITVEIMVTLVLIIGLSAYSYKLVPLEARRGLNQYLDTFRRAFCIDFSGESSCVHLTLLGHSYVS